jgi:hypothetical protein
LDESGILEEIRSLDKEIEPVNTILKKYDLLLGSENAYTPLRYHTNTCQFFYIYTGKVHIKIASWKYSKYVNENKDFFTYDFRSSVNVWKEEKEVVNTTDRTAEKYLLDNIPFIEFEVPENSIFYLPPYWWYSIRYTTSDTIILHYTYSTILNSMASVPDISTHYIKQWETTYAQEE